MKSGVVDTQGVTYPEPEKLPDPSIDKLLHGIRAGLRPGRLASRGCTGFDGGVEERMAGGGA